MRTRRSTRKAAATETEPRSCDWPGCTGNGEYRAPRSRRELQAYNWYCLPHIRQFNKSWNYYDGMSEHEVEQDIRRDVSWGRPTWQFGTPIGRTSAGPERVADPFDLFENSPPIIDTPATRRHTSEELKALRVLDLAPPVTPDEVKLRYKALAKDLHPDRNHGSRDSEEAFKRVNEAYRVLRPWLNDAT